MHSIYRLVDPRNNQVVYIGISCNPDKRIKQHINERGGNARKNAWIKELKRHRLLPIMQIIETANTFQEALEKEFKWIQYYLDRTVDLFNIQINEPLAPVHPKIVQTLLNASWKPINTHPQDKIQQLLLPSLSEARKVSEYYAEHGSPSIQRQAIQILIHHKHVSPAFYSKIEALLEENRNYAWKR